MEIEVKIDAARTLALLRHGGRRMAFAVVNALNDTAKEIQTGERQHVSRAFTVRKPEFLLRQAALIKGSQGGSGFASVGAGRFEARVSVGEKPRLLLSGFETGEARRPFKGKRVAVPLTGGPARPSFRSPVSEAFTFRQLALRRTTPRGQQRRKRRTNVTMLAQVTSGGKVQWKGAHRTFILTETARAPLGGVFQRIGPGSGDIRLVYSFKSVFRLPRRLKFVETGRRIADRQFQRNLLRHVSETLSRTLGLTG